VTCQNVIGETSQEPKGSIRLNETNPKFEDFKLRMTDGLVPLDEINQIKFIFHYVV